MAYAFGDTNNIKAHTEWGNGKYKAKFKPKTIILLDEHHEPMGFGENAKNTFVDTLNSFILLCMTIVTIDI